MIKFERKVKNCKDTRFGIYFGNHPPRYKKIFVENNILKKFKDQDQLLSCILLMEDRLTKVIYTKKPTINIYTNEIQEAFEVRHQYKFLDWECAYCKDSIKTKINNYKIENFVCVKCFEYYFKNNEKFISQIIIDSTLKFTDYYKGLLIKNQKQFLKYIKKK